MSDTRMIEIPLSDANDLDAVVHELGIEDSDTTPAEAVKELKAALDRAEAEKAGLRNENFDLRRYFDANEYVWKERDTLRAELAAAKQYGIDCLSAACVTHQSELAAAEAESDRLRAAYNDVRALNAQITLNLGAELAAVREALEPFAKISEASEHSGTASFNIQYCRAARTALQSHRRKEETT